MTLDATRTIPPLVDGERLTRDEFERRYHAMPHVKKAELLDGVVHMPSPVRFFGHGNPHYQLVGWMGGYGARTLGTGGSDNGTIRLDVINEPQPDVSLFVMPEYGGQVQISKDDYVEQAPDFVAEIAGSSKSIDLGAKFALYQRCGVREYLVWRVEDTALDWFVLRGEKFERLAPEGATFKSEVFPGLWLDSQALLAGDLGRVHDVLALGIASPEHASFVQRLKESKK